MAGSLTGIILGTYSGSNTYQPYLRWSISQSITDNRSTMSVTFGMYKARANSQSYNINPRTITVVVNGTTYTRSAGFDFRGAAVGSYNDMFTISDINIPHEADGSKSVAMSASHTTGISLGTGTISGTAVLLDIPRATMPSLSDLFVNLGDVLNITMTPAVDTFRHNLKCKYAGRSEYETIAINVTGTYAWTVPKSFANEISTSVSAPAEIICETFNGTTLLGTKTVPFTLLVPDTAEFAPSIVSDNITVADTDSALYSKFSGHVQNKSRLNISAAGAIAYNSPITRYEISVSGKSYIGSQITTDALTQNGALPVTVTVTDARGRYAEATKYITVYPYTAPQITAYTAYRSNSAGETDESGEYVTIYMAYSISSVNGKNDRNYTISYKRTNAETYTTAESGTAQTSFEGTYFVEGLTVSTDYRWDIRLEIWDYFTSSSHIARVQTLDTEEVILDFKASGTGVGIGKVSEEDDLVDIAWKVNLRSGITNFVDLVYPVGSVYISFAITNPQDLFGGTWEQIQGRFLLGVSAEHEVNETGGEEMHTLTNEEMPVHNHTLTGTLGSGGVGAEAQATTTAAGIGTSNSGGGLPHNNMPPYIAVYMWRRTA